MTQSQITPTNPEGTRAMALEMGLNDAEYDKAVEILGHTPTLTEVGMFSVMWSEHCGYKFSRPILRLISNYRQMADEGTMENAGVIPLGDGLGVVFKMESHNHPSAVEPVQGAATGVGGILRDIFTMGARPIASLDSIRFGPLSDPRTKYLFRGVVEGIAFYGNCVGVPTVGGEVVFHPAYAGNPLVNAMAIGLVEEGNIARATASGVGNPVLLVGARTGRDGIHGATFASVELTEESESRKSNVQCGDPFTEKLLIEATLEALATGHIAGIQDFGAAGLTCSTCETSAKAGTGMTIDVLKVPRREKGMTPYEVMLSESQERMLAIVEKGHEDEVAGVFRKWGLNAALIGEVTADGMVTVMEGDACVARVPADWLADRCPTYSLEASQPDYIDEARSADLSNIPDAEDHNANLMALLGNPSIASKRWVYRQYDHQVQTNSVVVPGAGDAAVLRVRGSRKGIAATTDCNARWCYLNPFEGARAAVAEAARNLACVGARPAGVTDCLNFGNPQKPEAFWQFEQAVKGMAAICEEWSIPIVSGNVSFYNETPDGSILPTPAIGMVGILNDVTKRAEMGFQREGDIIMTLGRPVRGVVEELGGSEYLVTVSGIEGGVAPAVDAAAETALRETLIEGIAAGHILSAHDVSDGGLATALAECCMVNGLGAEVVCGTDDRKDVALFAENPGRAVVSCRTEFAAAELARIAERHGCPCNLAGWVKGDRLKIGFDRHAIPVDAAVYDMWTTWDTAIPKALAE
ncbi:MAG TPA: phosphoribosylformylglycinamidine synthase subunit PurL [Armatimonadota bacterium]|jgi:phosphoribosylformylglycinamidine synthase